MATGQKRQSAIASNDGNSFARIFPRPNSFDQVRYQLLHRCASAVIEAKRLGCQHAAFIVQAFQTPDASFQDYAVFCEVLRMPATRGSMATTRANGIRLGYRLGGLSFCE